MKTFLAVGIAQYNDQWPRHIEHHIQAETVIEARQQVIRDCDMSYQWQIVETELPIKEG